MIQAAKTAARAELLREKLRARQLGRRVAGAAVAAVFIAAALIELHVAAYAVLVPYIGPVWTPVAIAGADALIAIVALSVGASARLERQAYEAADLRDRALGEVGKAAAVAVAAAPLIGLIRGRGTIGAALASAATAMLMRR